MQKGIKLGIILVGDLILLFTCNRRIYGHFSGTVSPFTKIFPGR